LPDEKSPEAILASCSLIRLLIYQLIRPLMIVAQGFQPAALCEPGQS